MSIRKLSASGMALYLKSPKAFYWRYIAKLENAQPSVGSFDHDKIAGSLWAEFVDRFYHGIGEKENTLLVLQDWRDQTSGWVPDKTAERLETALTTLMGQYYQCFSSDDGARTPEGSELWLENDRFVGRLDGLSRDGIIHECKSTSRSPQIGQQLWKVGNSIQVKLYAVLANANGYCIEFAWKDAPHQVYRGPITEVTADQRRCWERELNALADEIQAKGDNPCNFVCHSDGCNITGKNFVSMCQYKDLCDGLPEDVIPLIYKTRADRR